MLLSPTASSIYVRDSGVLRTRSSKEGYRSLLSQLQATCPGRELDQFTTRDLTKFCLGDGSLAVATVKHRRTVVRQFFEWVTYMKMVKTNPANDLKFTVRPGHDFGSRQHNWLTETDVASVMRTCPADEFGARMRVIFLSGFMLGLRASDISSMKWEDLARDMVSLRVLGKGHKPVQLGVPPQLRTELSAWRRTAGLGAQFVVPACHAGPFDRQLDWAKGIAPGRINEICQQSEPLSGLFFRAHDMRRSFAGILEAKGVNIQDISRLLRHSDVGTTSRYLERNPSRVTSLADSFELAL